MPRRTADERHAERSPRPWPPQDEHALLDAIVAINHPTRRALYEALDGGSADVGTLAARVGVAAGSASHHLGVLASAGWIEAAPELARDTRHTVWRSLDRSLTWSSDDLAPGTRGRRIAEDVNTANVNRNHDLLLAALKNPARRTSVSISDWHARATDAQCDELNRRILDVVKAWRDEVETSDIVHCDTPADDATSDGGTDTDHTDTDDTDAGDTGAGDARIPRRIVMWQAPMGERR